MPEYLAPGVYVEETSFRAKSIEGVGTSTTAFVGPTRRGPLAATRNADDTPVPLPELLTSFGDFVRTYGGLGDIELGGVASRNYLAHAVLNFFNEGGVRLYVARVGNGATAAAGAIAGDLTAPDDGNRVFVRARFAGRAGNGRIAVREILTSATRGRLDAAAENTLLRAAGTVPTEPARISGGSGAGMSVRNGSVLRLMVNGTPRDLTFRGEHTEATAGTGLPAATVIDATNQNLTVTLNGTQTVITVPPGTYTPAELTLAINAGRLAGGYARLGAGDRLIIGTDRLGHAGRVQVARNDAFGFTADADEQRTSSASNNMPDLGNVTAADLATLLASQPGPFATAALTGGRLVISSTALGDNQTLAVADATDAAAGRVSAHAALGFALPGPGDPPSRGSNVRLYRKLANGEWRDGTNNQLTLPDNAGAVAGNVVSLLVSTVDGDDEVEEYDELSLVPTSPRFVGRVLGAAGLTRADSLQRLFAFDIGGSVNALALHGALFPAGRTTGDIVEGLAAVHVLSGGTDGDEPGVGVPTGVGTYAAAFEQLRGLEDISIIAAPGHSSFSDSNYRTIQRALIAHAGLPRAYRIAVLDTPPNQLPGQAREERAQIDSTRAAMYYPWVTVGNPLARPGRDDIAREINLPPSGFICGIYARNDVEQTVAKAPANEVVRGALRFESDVNFAQNQLLNPLGVNCLRYFPGRGFRVWGARTAGSDPEVKYVNVRRYLLYLEASIDRGTQWAVFENNGPRLWTNITETVDAFLYNEWVSGNLLGGSAKEAFFVRCDRTTMTQNDLDNGRLICLIGVALLKPAEFVIFRIGQKTADARS
jgi:phage tail sheath protein FI